MANDNRINLPSSGGGIVRYFEDLTSKINLKPEVVMVIIVLVIIFELLLQLYGNSFLGLK